MLSVCHDGTDDRPFSQRNDGKLIDGQHRLSAVVAAAATVPMIVVRNVESTVMDTVDAGAKGSYPDALKMQGEENTSTLAAVDRRR